MKKAIALAIFIFLWGQAALASPTIYFLRNGEVWQADSDGSDQKVVTHTEETIRSFLFSPAQDFLAFEKIIDREELLTTLVVMRMSDEMVVYTLPHEGFLQIGLIHWTPDLKVRFYKGGHYEVIGFYELNNETQQVKTFDHTLAGADYSPDGSAILYSFYSGLGETFRDTLYLEDISSGQRQSLLSVRHAIGGAFFPDGSRIAYSAHEKDGYSYGFCEVFDGSCVALYRGPSLTQGGGAGFNNIYPSPRGQFIAILNYKKSIIIPLNNPEEIRIAPNVTSTASWLDESHLLIGQHDGIFSFDVEKGKKELLIKNGTLPIALHLH